MIDLQDAALLSNLYHGEQAPTAYTVWFYRPGRRQGQAQDPIGHVRISAHTPEAAERLARRQTGHGNAIACEVSR